MLAYVALLALTSVCIEVIKEFALTSTYLSADTVGLVVSAQMGWHMEEVAQDDWFRIADARRRRLSSGIWIPLRQAETLRSGGTKWKPGYFEESLCVGTLAVFAEHREVGSRLSWDDIGLSHEPRPYAFEDGRYKPAEQYWHHDDDFVGVELVLLNRTNQEHHVEWLVNQDLVLALGLIREEDSWLRPDEGYVEVIRQRRDLAGSIVALEIRAEHLRDYLCARKLALRLVQYRERIRVLEDASYLPWYADPLMEESTDERFELRAFPIGPDGGIPGRVAVMKVWRTDVDHQVDVPEFGQEDDSNTDFESYEFERKEATVDRVEGLLWRDEWIEAAETSERVRGDTPVEQLYYKAGAAGQKVAASRLNSEDVGQYLWFKAEVVEALLGYRNSSLIWHTAETGSIACSPDYAVHFGINAESRINVYAYDIVRLPLWQQQIWHGYNITPDGPPSIELQEAQFRCKPADTEAPEVTFQALLAELNQLFVHAFGSPVFKPHEHAEQISKECHRFRALKENGVLGLAKDIARLTADSIDVALLRKIVKLGPEEQKLGGLKLLERLLQTYSDKETSYKIMGPLHIAYSLRLGDAHLPSGTQQQKALDDLGIRPETQPLVVAKALLVKVCQSLSQIGYVVFRGTHISDPASNGSTSAD